MNPFIKYTRALGIEIVERIGKGEAADWTTFYEKGINIDICIRFRGDDGRNNGELPDQNHDERDERREEETEQTDICGMYTRAPSVL